MDLSFIVAFIILISGLGIGGLAVGLFATICALTRRVKELEQASDRRHLPYKVADEIEDATAAILKLEHEMQFRKELIENALNHLRKARNNK